MTGGAFIACGEQERSDAAAGRHRGDVPAAQPTGDQPTCGGEEADLVDDYYPPPVAGDARYAYHKTGQHDLDGDGAEEAIHVLARAVKEGSEYSWDDGSPWHVYVEEPPGERTYLYSGWVQLGILEVAVVWRDGPGADLLIQHEGGAGYSLHCAEYRGPGNIRTTDIVGFAVHERVGTDG